MFAVARGGARCPEVCWPVAIEGKHAETSRGGPNVHLRLKTRRRQQHGINRPWIHMVDAADWSPSYKIVRVAVADENDLQFQIVGNTPAEEISGVPSGAKERETAYVQL